MQEFKNPYYLPTGNDYLSIPTLYSENAAIESINFLHMGYRGLVELTGSKESPLIAPYLTINGAKVQLQGLTWEREGYWLPRFGFRNPEIELRGVICAPLGERGFLYRLEVDNISGAELEVGLGMQGTWIQCLHSVNESKPIRGEKLAYYSNWNNGLAFDFRTFISMASFGAIASEEVETFCWINGEPVAITEQNREALVYDMSEELSYVMCANFTLEPTTSRQITFYWGVGIEEVGAMTSAKELYRHGADKVLEQTVTWLRERELSCREPQLNGLVNLNAFFNYFFAMGKTIDTEELVLVTSRSPRYYVSAAYWDRDSLLWSFPSVLTIDPVQAKAMLDYVFTRQIRNIGVHSRYIDGTLLEPGFELDELCAPIIALHNFVEKTQDYAYLDEEHIRKGIGQIVSRLAAHRHPDVALYDTFLLPTDDVTPHPYVTYNNVLVWKTFGCLADFAVGQGKQELAQEYLVLAGQVQAAVMEHCLMEHNGKRIFAWSTDLEGEYRFYDEPPGTLQLLPFYGFCRPDDQVYLATVNEIRSPLNRHAFSGCAYSELGCEHAEHPWVLSIGNSLLSGREQEAKKLLLALELDGGIACESFDEHTGECRTGEAFATCAGFLAFAVYYAFGS